MVDLTLNEYDRENFITNILLSDKFDKFTVCFADGSSKVEDFSIDDFNSTLELMEEQFHQYKKSCLLVNYKKKIYSVIRLFMSLALELAGMISVFNTNIQVLYKVVCLIICFFASHFYQLYEGAKLEEINSVINTIKLSEIYLYNKDKYAVDIMDSDGKLKKWYIVNLSNIDFFKKHKYYGILNFDFDDVNTQESTFVKKLEK